MAYSNQSEFVFVMSRSLRDTCRVLDVEGNCWISAETLENAVMKLILFFFDGADQSETHFVRWMLQRTATHCNTLPHTATHCNTLQSIRDTFRALDVEGNGQIRADVPQDAVM